MTRRSKNQSHFLVIGQGDGTIEEWLAPLHDLNHIGEILRDFDRYNTPVDWRFCTRGTRIFRSLIAQRGYIGDELDLIQGHPAVSIESETYGERDDMPGRSGKYLVVKVLKSKRASLTAQVSRLLDNLEDFWNQSPGPLKMKFEMERLEQKKMSRNKNDLGIQESRKSKSEKLLEVHFDGLTTEIKKFLKQDPDCFLQPDNAPRVLCEPSGCVYILTRDPYETEASKKEAEAFANALENQKIKVIRIEQYMPKGVGQIPYFSGFKRLEYQGWRQNKGRLQGKTELETNMASTCRDAFLATLS